MRFTVHRPPSGEVSLCCYHPSGGDVACRVHVSVAWAHLAGNAGEDRLTLAVFGSDMSAGGAPLRRVRGGDALDSSRGLMVEPSNQLAPALTADSAVEASFLRNPYARLVNRAARRASHRPHIERLDSNNVESARQSGSGFFRPIASTVSFACFQSGNCQSGTSSAVRAAFSSREASLQPAQPDLLTRCEARCMQQFPGGQRCRHGHTAIDSNDAAIPRSRDRGGNMGKRDMPAPSAVPRDSVGLDSCGHNPSQAESHPSDLGHPDLAVAPVQLCDMAPFDPDLSKTLIQTGLAKRRTSMGARKEVVHGLGEVPQRLLLHRLRSGRQPVVFGADLGQLGGLLVVPRGTTARLPPLLLLDGQVPHKPGMSAMLQQHHLLSRRRQQPEPRHIRKLTAGTDIGGPRSLPRCEGGRFRPKEN